MLGLPAVTLQDASKFQQHMEHKKKLQIMGYITHPTA
jgi:hypothetical protein